MNGAKTFPRIFTRAASRGVDDAQVRGELVGCEVEVGWGGVNEWGLRSDGELGDEVRVRGE